MNRRQNAIIEIITNYEIEKQEELVDKLNELGYKKIVKCLCVPNIFINHDKIANQREKLHLTLNDLDNLINS